mmetsp:Transcript_78514/g.173245  ORF Transcript_78514/g.173245 Transcript_78514/m.173245 type:complete len:492 (+) Transcript_78514:58-1533(+)
MLKPVAAVGGALALAGAGAIGAISLMENFVVAGIQGVDACDENPVGQVGPFKSSLSFQCTEGSSVKTSSDITVDEQYASFRVPADLESVETAKFWPLFPNRNQYGQAETFKDVPAGPLVAEFKDCETSWAGSGSSGVDTFSTLVAAGAPPKVAEAQAKITAGNQNLTDGNMLNYFKNALGPAGIVQVCQGTATEINSVATVVDIADCDNVVDFAPMPTTDSIGGLRAQILSNIPDATSFTEVLTNWNDTLNGALTDESLVALASEDAQTLAEQCQTVGIQGLVQAAGTNDPATLAAQYAGIALSPAECTGAFVGGPAEPSLIATVEERVLTALVSGIASVDNITDLSNTTQLEKLIVKCKDQEEDLAAIETAQILLPAGAAAAGVAAILLFVAVATAKAPLVLAGGVLGLVGGVLTLVALLGVRNAPVYGTVTSDEPTNDGDVLYEQGLGGTLGYVGIGAPVVGGLLGVGSFFCGTGEEGGALSSKVDNTY